MGYYSIVLLVLLVLIAYLQIKALIGANKLNRIHNISLFRLKRRDYPKNEDALELIHQVKRFRKIAMYLFIFMFLSALVLSILSSVDR